MTAPRPTMPRLKPRQPAKAAALLDAYNESAFRKAYQDAANATGLVYLWRQQSGVVRGMTGSRVHLAPTGAADLVGYVIGSGRHLEAETKGPGGKQSDEQKDWQRDVEAAGGLYLLAVPGRGETLGAAVTRCVAELRAALAEAERAEKGVA